MLVDSIQRVHGPQAALTGLPRADVLPAPEAPGGGQDTRPRARPAAEPEPAADGGPLAVCPPYHMLF